MSFAEGVLRLVRIGAHVETEAPGEPRHVEPATPSAEGAASAGVAAGPLLDIDLVPTAEELGAVESPRQEDMEPGLADLEAAVALVSAGLATRVVLTGFQSWPGLLWRAYELADHNGVVILPTVVRPGGRVDIAITGVERPNG